MAQPIKKNINLTTIKKTKKDSSTTKKKKHKDYGTSKLEVKFAKEFLDKLGVEYVYQFKAESIGRFYDFFLPKENVLIEVDGDFYHSFGLVYEDMSPMQKRNRRVDKQKDHWALINGIPIIRIWEHDINNNPEGVMKMLKENLATYISKKEIEDRKKKRNFKKNDN